jgi:leucyl/phenylalanyl-tRNA---protein transferase
MQITPELLLQAYAAGIFPMAENADDEALHWYEPQARGIIPLERFHVSRSLAKTVRQDRFEIVADRDFDAVIEGCAGGGPDRQKTWINRPIRRMYRALFGLGHCHTVEARMGGHLVGGLYGVSLGGAFFGESMFHRATDASKVCMVHLVARLKHAGYGLLDAQFVTTHLTTFGAVEISRRDYKQALGAALRINPDADVWNRNLSGAEALDAAQTSNARKD